MELLITPKSIDQRFLKLIRDYEHLEWLSAWGGISFPSYQAFIKAQEKCRKVVIGTHFFQTHPEFIESTLKNKGIRFVKQTDELFHPKAYLFYNSDSDWQLLIGSANFTHGAFTANAEIMLQINQDSEGSAAILRQFKNVVDRCWNDAEQFTSEQLEDY